MLILYSVVFIITCNVYNISFLLEGYMILSTSNNPMDLSNMLNPDNNHQGTGSGGGGGGGPSNPHPIAPPPENSTQTPGDQGTSTSEALANPTKYQELGSKLENKVNSVLAKREEDLEIEPFSPSGIRYKLRESIQIYDLKLMENDYYTLKEWLLLNRNNHSIVIPKNFNKTVIYNSTLKYDIINLIKNSR